MVSVWYLVVPHLKIYILVNYFIIGFEAQAGDIEVLPVPAHVHPGTPVFTNT